MKKGILLLIGVLFLTGCSFMGGQEEHSEGKLELADLEIMPEDSMKYDEVWRYSGKEAIYEYDFTFFFLKDRSVFYNMKRMSTIEDLGKGIPGGGEVTEEQALQITEATKMTLEMMEIDGVKTFVTYDKNTQTMTYEIAVDLTIVDLTKLNPQAAITTVNEFSVKDLEEMFENTKAEGKRLLPTP